MREKIVGIAGGMGPESTTDLMQKIFAATRAEREQDHIHLIVDSNPKTPDRMEFILGGGESPVPVICEGIRHLAAAGADLILIPCNTAHAFFDELQAATSVPIVNMIELCAGWIRDHYTEGDRLGILATTGTVRSGIYETALRRRGLDVIFPSDTEQQELMEAIFGPRGIKMGCLAASAPRVVDLATKLIDRGAKAVVAGCTEVGLVLTDCDFTVIDPLRLLAEEAVRLVKGPDGVVQP